MGVSRKCVKTWIDRYAAEGEAGLATGPRGRTRCPTRTSAEVEQQIVELRRTRAARARTGSAPSSGCRPGPCRGSCAATSVPLPARAGPDHRRGDPGLEGHRGPLRTRPARRAGPHGRQEDRPDPRRRRLAGPRPRRRRQPRPARHGIGYDYVHSLVDDHSRLAYSEILPDEKGTTCAAFLDRAPIDYFADHGITRIERLMTDNAWAYRYSLRDDLRRARHHAEVHQAPLPLAKRQGRTLQPHPASRMGLPPGLHQQRRPHRRPCALARALQHSTPPQRTRRTPTDQPTVTNLMAEYNYGGAPRMDDRLDRVGRAGRPRAPRAPGRSRSGRSPAGRAARVPRPPARSRPARCGRSGRCRSP